MTKEDIAERVAMAADIPLSEAKKGVAAVINQMTGALRQGEPVILRKFGTFTLRDKGERMGRNPKTGEPAHIPPRTVVRFKPGNTFKSQVNP